MAETRLQDEDLQLKTMIGELEDADFIESVSQLQIRDSALQAALAAVGKSLNTSLLDFLR
jgi:flagellin-like hook-associated protein FlgL